MSASSNSEICFLATRASLSAVGVLGRNQVYVAKKGPVLGAGPSPMKPPEWSRQIRELVRAKNGRAPIDTLEPGDIALVHNHL